SASLGFENEPAVLIPQPFGNLVARFGASPVRLARQMVEVALGAQSLWNTLQLPFEITLELRPRREKTANPPVAFLRRCERKQERTRQKESGTNPAQQIFHCHLAAGR